METPTKAGQIRPGITPARNQVKPPTREELLKMEDSYNYAHSYLSLLRDIVNPPEALNDPDPGLERFSSDSRFAMLFMMGDIFNALNDFSTLIEYSFNVQANGEQESKS